VNEAAAPALLSASAASRVLVFAFACKGSGVPPAWLAGLDKPGVNLLPDLSPATARFVAGRIAAAKQIGDLVVASIHWGGNWGYVIPSTQRTPHWNGSSPGMSKSRAFAHRQRLARRDARCNLA